MISLRELLGENNLAEIPHEHQINLEYLQEALNKFRQAYGHPMIVTSGYRTPQQHRRIYGDPSDPHKVIPLKSNHLYGLACDFADPDLKLVDFILGNKSLCEEWGLYFEDFNYTPGWVHMQIVPPASKRRVFVPYSGPPKRNVWNGVW